MYTPDTGDNVLPDIIIRDTGCAMENFLVVPGIVIVKSPLNCEANAFMSLIMLTVWNTSGREALQLLTTSAPCTIVLPLPSTANPTEEKFMLDILYATPLYEPEIDNMFVLDVPYSNVSAT